MTENKKLRHGLFRGTLQRFTAAVLAAVLLTTGVMATDRQAASESSIGSASAQLTAGTVSPASGTLCDTIYWSIDENGVLTVSGSGEIPDFAQEPESPAASPWREYNEVITAVVVEEGITRIGKYAFSSFNAMETIALPDTLESIGDYALDGSYKLQSVTLPEKLTSLGEDAFGCSGLTAVTLPGSITELGAFAFGGCKALETVIFSDGITAVSAACFTNCSKLSKVLLPASLTMISSNAFNACASLTEIALPPKLETIQESAFNYCSKLKEITIPGTVTEIGLGAFMACTNLLRVTIEEGATDIGSGAFDSCACLESVTIPGSVSEIEFCAFYGCSNLTSVSIASGVEHIGDGAFYECEALSSITIPASVTKIEEEAFTPGSSLCISGYYGSAAQSYAADHGFSFTLLSPFADVQDPDSYYYEPALWAASRGITAGKTSTTFCPEGACTRAQLVTFLWRAAGCPSLASKVCAFTDVSKDAYYYDAVLWATENDITYGKSSTAFSPDDRVTRAQVVTFLWRYAGKPAPKTTASPFHDVTDPTAYYYDAVLWAAENEIALGVTPDRFAPGQNCNRAQVVTFLFRDFAP